MFLFLKKKKKVQGMTRGRSRLSYVIKDSYDRPEHISGINALALDATGLSGSGKLYSGARDSTVNVWNLHLDGKKTSHSMRPSASAENVVS